MRRREFISLLCSAAVWPLAARAQQSVLPVVGYLDTSARNARVAEIGAFHRGLGDFGYIEGQNVRVEYRFCEGEYDRAPALAAELIERQVSVIVAGVNAGAVAARAASTMTPVVFFVAADPVELGLVPNLSRPGGNVTGVSFFNSGLEGKRLGLLHELMPTVGEFAALINTSQPTGEAAAKEVMAAASTLGLRVRVFSAASADDIEHAFVAMSTQRIRALLVTADSFYVGQTERLTGLAQQYSVPAIYFQRQMALAGGLASYGTSLAEVFRQVGSYAGQILKGAKPADLPVVQSTKFEFVINMKAAKILALDITPTLSARADEVIE